MCMLLLHHLHSIGLVVWEDPGSYNYSSGSMSAEQYGVHPVRVSIHKIALSAHAAAVACTSLHGY